MVGAHVESANPIEAAAAVGADCVQIFVGNPQSWRKPKPREDADELRKWGVPIYVHAPYLINVASPDNKIRIPSRKILQDTCDASAAIGAKAVIVHAGHSSDGVDNGLDRWAKALAQLETDVRVLIENTAGGDNAMGRRFEDLDKLWTAVESYNPGFCFDTCHAHAAGEDLSDAVERVIEIVGTIDLVHANDSKDPAGSGRDRHTNLGTGQIDPDALRHMIRAANAPVIVETPPAGIPADIEWVRAAL